MITLQRIQSIENSTGKAWGDWLDWLGENGARGMNHPAIAKLVGARLKGKVENPGWWAQSIAVAYEQAISRRLPAQRADGSFEVSASRTFSMQREQLFNLVSKRLSQDTKVDGQPIIESNTSMTPVRSYWRAKLANPLTSDAS